MVFLFQIVFSGYDSCTLMHFVFLLFFLCLTLYFWLKVDAFSFTLFSFVKIVAWKIIYLQCNVVVLVAFVDNLVFSYFADNTLCCATDTDIDSVIFSSFHQNLNSLSLRSRATTSPKTSPGIILTKDGVIYHTQSQRECCGQHSGS